jgi:hypothetical protein
MVFKPQAPGDYAHYVYAGEILAGFLGEGKFPTAPVTDAAGNFYIGGGTGGESIQMFAPEAPGAYPAPHSSPLCTFNYPISGITAVTVDPQTGEPFFFSYKKPKLVHRLGPCNLLTGKFEKGGKEEIETIAVKPERDDLWGMAFDPVRQFSPGRAAGVLFAGAPTPVPDSGVGKGEPGQSALGYIFAAAEENPPTVGAATVAKVRATSALLRASIDPKGFPTHYIFQYLSEAEYEEAGKTFAGAAEAPLGGATLVGTGAQSVAVTVTELDPGTEYRFRVVAKSNCKPSEPLVICEADGVPGAFHTFAADLPMLPDSRAWELVSPVQKFGGQVLPADPRITSCEGREECKPGKFYLHFPMQSSSEGNAVAYEGTGFGSEGASTENQYVSHRTAAGWHLANPTPPLLLGARQSGYRALSGDLTEALLGQASPALSPGAPPEYENLYAQPVSEPLSLEPLLKQAPPHRPSSGEGVFQLRYVGSSTDGSRVFFEANDALTAGTAVAPAAQDGGSGKFNLYEWSGGQLALVNVKPGNAEAPAGASFGAGPNVIGNAISADGGTAFWSDEAGQVYARIGGAETRKVEDPGKYLSASTDGLRVLLQDGCLYDLEAEDCTDLSAGKGGFQGIVGQSDDLSHVYFVDTAVLTGEEKNSEGVKAQPGENNLYSWVEGATAFVATLAVADNKGGGTFNPVSDWALSPAGRTAEASSGGRFVSFLSIRKLTGYENTGLCESDHLGGRVNAPCSEVFVYDSASAKLRCASCDPSGAPPLGLSMLRLIDGPIYLPQPRYLTDAGRLYFDSQDSLSPYDTNEGAEDVYQWEPDEVGNCELEEGCVRLLSGGREATDSNFLAMDETGANVFFTTRERLVGADSDELIDLYDAREGGGFPEPPPPTGCQGEGCQPLFPPPLEPPPPSATISDPGNVKPAKGCKKGQVKKKGKCVKKHPKSKPATHKRGGSR